MNGNLSGFRSQSHLRTPSRETSVSGIAESTISNVESLSQFPIPPVSIPTTPVSSAPSSPARRFAPSPNVSSIGPSTRTIRNVPSSDATLPSSPYSPKFSPHDWHEGASSIYVDDVEDRLLSTTFITSLLREPSKAQSRSSVGSDAFSGMSEMTYPPTARYHALDSPSEPSLLNQQPPFHRQQGARPPRHPPTAFPPIPENSGYHSDYSDTTCEHEDHDGGPTVIRSARGVSMHDASVVGVASATIKSIGSVADTRRPKVATPIAAPIAPTTRAGSRLSNHSTKSYSPSFFSKISSTGRSILRAAPWNRKPLPPVPTIPHISIAEEREYRSRDSALPLSQLIRRADRLDEMLNKGHHPHNSILRNSNARSARDTSSSPSSHRLTMTPTGGYSKYSDAWQLSSNPSASEYNPDDEKPIPRRVHLSPKHKKFLIACLIVVVIAVAIGVGVAVSQSKANALHDCPDGLAGANCDLNSTCVCTSSSPGRCNGLAQNIVTLTPTMNSIFQTNHSLNTVYNSIWIVQGSSPINDCAPQSNQVDVGKALSASDLPNRTEWAQAALLWNLVESQDGDAVNSMRSFILDAPWSNIERTDGPVPDDNSNFAVSASGFNFNFATQRIDQDVVSFEVDGQPSNEQISRIDDVALTALDRMYGYALASSTQQRSSLATFWTSVLQQRADDLNVFLALVASSTILLPFDATVTQDLLRSSIAAFPPPLSCFPDLSDDEVNRIESVESLVFDLSPLNRSTKFDASCYPERPIYGVVDLLKLRLPFSRVEGGIPLQAVALNRDVGPRAVIRSGELLSAFPAGALTPQTPHPRQYGTLNHMNHVILSYLSSMDTTLAVDIVKYVLAYKTVPPDSGSSIVRALDQVPTLEVAIFGNVVSEDIGSSVSSFSTASGALFFGSEAGSVFRNWTIGDLGKPVTWTENSTSELVASDTSLTDEDFAGVLAAASAAVANNVSSVGVDDVVSSLTSLGKMG